MHDEPNSGKLKITLILFGWLWLKMDMRHFLNELMSLADFLHAYTYSGKLKVTQIVIRWAWSNMCVAFRSWDSKFSCIPRIN